MDSKLRSNAVPQRLAEWLLIGLLSASCSQSVPPPPTEEEALAYLDAVVELVLERDFAGLCELGSGNCERHLNDADPSAAPFERPTVASSSVLAPTPGSGGGNRTGGRLLRLCGVDAWDRPYASDMLVFRSGNKLISIEPVYWAGTMIDTGSQSFPDRPPPGCE